ncbi:MAG TPA: hypothetical protein VHK88_07955 [Aquihabitans sp.]|jgi:hypothetical protein|nr:hypothetical protein [Aquihabitans sp.]
MVDVEEVPVRGQRNPVARPWTAFVLAAALLAGCSSSDDDGGSAASRAEALRAANRAYLLERDFERDQARCISRKVTVDLEELLSAPDGDEAVDDREGYEQLEAATAECIRADADVTSTTVAPG